VLILLVPMVRMQKHPAAMVRLRALSAYQLSAQRLSADQDRSRIIRQTVACACPYRARGVSHLAASLVAAHCARRCLLSSALQLCTAQILMLQVLEPRELLNLFASDTLNHAKVSRSGLRMHAKMCATRVVITCSHASLTATHALRCASVTAPAAAASLCRAYAVFMRAAQIQCVHTVGLVHVGLVLGVCLSAQCMLVPHLS
jgi:hypothetical protein